MSPAEVRRIDDAYREERKFYYVELTSPLCMKHGGDDPSQEALPVVRRVQLSDLVGISQSNYTNAERAAFERQLDAKLGKAINVSGEPFPAHSTAHAGKLAPLVLYIRARDLK
jgi:hypothetical protein